MINKIINFLILALIVLNIFFSAWYVLNGDVLFHTDIARDFLLMEELRIKKIILIGGRASGIPGVFHGPLWIYINFPIFLLSKGNPIIHGWFWVFLNIIFLLTSYLIVKKLFNNQIALLATLLISFPMFEFTKGMYHPYGALMLMPFFFYTFFRYIESGNSPFLLVSIFFLGLITQFHIAFGLSFILISAPLIFYKIFKDQKYYYLLAFLVLIIPFSTWIIFDFRHDFIQLKTIISYIFHTQKTDPIRFDEMLHDRIKGIFFHGLYLTHGTYEWFNIILSQFLGIVSYLVIKAKKSRQRTLYLLLLYFHIGFWIVSLFHRGIILYHMYIAIIFIPLLLFSATSLFSNKKIFTLIYAILILFNLIWVRDNIVLSGAFFDRDQTSWRGQLKIVKEIFNDAKNEEFGYFIYSPDIVGYTPKYAMIYGQKINPQIKAYPFQKKPLTYLIIAPPPPDKPFLNDIFWKSDQINIKKQPVKIFTFLNGYRVEKYRLNEKEIRLEPQKYLNIGLEVR